MVTIPVAVYLLAVWFLHVRPQDDPPLRGALLPLGAVVVLLVTFTGQPVLAAGLAVAILVAVAVALGARSLGTLEYDADGVAGD